VRRLKVAAALVGISAIALAGCTSKAGSPNPAPTSTIGVDVQSTDPNAKGPADEVPGAKKGGTITVYSESTPTGFDPTDIYYVDSYAIGKLFYRTPTQYDIRNGSPVLVPDLTDLGTVSADGLTWKFKLKGSFKYEDGTPVTVDDLAYSVKRSFAHDIYENGPTYQMTYFKDGDKYKGPYKDGLTYAGVSTEGTDTLVINLAKPFSDLPFYLSFPAFTPIPATKDTKQDYQNHPLSTGPYMFDSYTAGAELKLKKNPNWDPATDPVRHQYPDAWDFKWGQDDVKTQQAILAGGAADQNALGYGNIDATVIPLLTGKMDQLLQGPSPCTLVVQLDTRKITDINVRKAIALAYPYDQTWTVAGLNDYVAERASTVMPPSVPGYNKYTPFPGLSGTGKGDPAAAKALLQTAGKLGFELSWFYDNTKPIPQQTTQLRKEAFEAAGFTVRPVGVTTAELRKKLGDYDADVNMGQSPSGWCSDWPTGGSWFPVLFQSHSVDDGTSWGMLKDPALDKQIDDVSALPQNQQAAKWGELDKQIMGMYVALPRYYDKMAIIIGKNIGGGVGDGTVGMPFFVDMFLK
jgi:peptide/nickel transport system substrate-binding protein